MKPSIFLADQLTMGKMLVINPAEEYRKQMGDEEYERQKKLADLEAGRCVCEPQKLKRRWEGADKLTTRAVHAKDCPRRKPWMEEYASHESH